MRRAALICSVAWICFQVPAGSAQVSVPLPGARPAPGTTPPNQAPPRDTTVPLPGTRPPVTDPEPDRPRVPIGRHGRPDINPYERDINMTVPLQYRDRSLGDVEVQLTFDDRILIDSAGFLRLLLPLLNTESRNTLAAALGTDPRFAPETLIATGIRLEYDPASLSVVIVRLDPNSRAVENLFAQPVEPTDDSTIRPARFSAYLNINAATSYQWSDSRFLNPLINLNGAVRVGPIVIEGDGQFSDSTSLSGTTTSYAFRRNYARLVYDQPESFRRWSLGDLDPEIRGQQSFAQLGGVSLTRQRRRFNAYRSGVLQGNRQFVLQREATVRIMRNGTLYQELRLDPGTYDLSSLPLLSGSNDIQLEIRDSSGSVQNLNYSSYLDPIDLEPGDFEYGLYVGKMNRRFGGSPTYGGPLALSGFFRRAPVNRPAYGIGIQATEAVQILTGQTQFILDWGGRLLVDAGASHSENGAGFAAGIAYDQVIDRAGLVDSFTIRADYFSRRFGSLTVDRPDVRASWSLNGQYTRAIRRDLAVAATASIQGSRDADSTSYRIGALTNYRFSPNWSVRAGIDYTRLPSRFATNDGPGFTISLVYQPTFRRRVEARYDSPTEMAQLSYTSAGANQINSLGYGAVATRDPDASFLQAFADYSANRFDASFSHAAFGRDFTNIGSTNITSLRVGTSIAFADGAFGFGRRINDSFAILYPHPNLRGRSVVAGQSLARNQYIGRSGTFGGAVNNFLSSYVNQSIQYDVQDPPAGYDIGPGIYRVTPPYRSGYAIRVGTDAFVSAVGTLMLPEGGPASLLGGRVIPLDGRPAEASQPMPFFTNSAGRFAIPNLYPGRRYRVEIYSASGGVIRSFAFTVPADSDGLVNLGPLVSGAGNME